MGAELAILENRGVRRSTLFGTSGSSPIGLILDLALSGAPIEFVLRRFILDVMFHGALSRPQLTDCFATLLDVYGPQHTATLTALEAAGLLPAKQPRGSTDTESAGAAMRVLLDKAEANSRSHKDTLSLASIIDQGAAEEAPGSPVASGAPYGTYKPVSALLIRSAMRKYVPDWAKARSDFTLPQTLADAGQDFSLFLAHQQHIGSVA
jgi:hypothetical protein